MKAFINRIFILLLATSFWTGCSKDNSATSEQPLEVETVEEITPNKPLPPAEKVIPAQAPVVQVSARNTEQKIASVASSQQTLYPGEVMTYLKQWDKKLKTLRTRFTQTSSYDGVEISRAQGTLFYDQKIPLIRVDSISAQGRLEQTLITDKNKMMLLDESAHQVAAYTWEEWKKGQTNEILFDVGNFTDLLAKHNVELTQPNVLKLTPKKGEQYTLTLTLSPRDYFPVSFQIDSELMTTQTELIQTEKNAVLAESTFGGFFK